VIEIARRIYPETAKNRDSFGRFIKGHELNNGRPRPDVVKRNKGKNAPRNTGKTRFKSGEEHPRYWLDKKRSKETIEKIRKANIGRKLSKEHKLKLSMIHSERCKNNPQIVKRLTEKRKGSKLTELHKSRIKEARKKQILPKRDSSIEIKIQYFLKALGIDFFTHQYIKDIKHGYQCDILIPSMKMVIECDGNYWHRYPVGTELDHIRTKELIKNGFRVLRLWESEINTMSINDFKGRLYEKNIC